MNILKKIRQASIFASLCVFLITLVVPMMSFISPPLVPSASAQTTPENDLIRRRLETLRDCLIRRLDYGDGRYDDFEDFFNNNGEVVVVGFDRDSNNGVMTCRTAVLQGMRSLGSETRLGRQIGNNSSDSEVINAFSFILNGRDFNDSTDGVQNGGSVLQNRNALIESITALLGQAKFSRPPNSLRVKRILQGHSLVDICYEVSEAGNRSGSLGENGFELTLRDGTELEFKQRSSAGVENQLQAAGFITEVGLSGGNNKIGDVGLGFAFASGIRQVGDFESFKSDFYPIGSDIGETEGYTDRAIVDCGFIKANQDWLRAPGVLFQDGQLGFDEDGDGTIDGAPNGDIGNAGGDQNVTCEARLNNPLSWILCPIFNAMADLTDWLFTNLIEPFLYTSPVDTNPEDPSFQAWSSFRVIANVLLILAMLVIVFGQTIGGGAIDAYTAKKVLPRILAAAILINLSIYLVNAMVDITNVIGRGIGLLLWTPFASAGGANFELSGATSLTGFSLGALGVILSASSILGFLGGVGSGGGAFIILAVLVPALLALLGVFVTLILRRGLLLFLIISAPIAFVLYVLPNTEQYFRKWWDLFVKALMMYPIIIIVFTLADIMSLMVLRTSGVRPENVGNAATVPVGQAVGGVVAFILQFLPLFIIPFAFKLAGSAISGIYTAISSGGKKVGDFSKQRGQAQKDKYDAGSLKARRRTYERGARLQKSDSALARTAGRALMWNRVVGYNLQQEEAAENEKWAKTISDIKNNGKDDWVRALFAQKDENGEYVRDEKGKIRTIGGGSVTEDDIRQAERIFGGNHHAFQAALSYEMTKAAEQGQQDSLVHGYAQVAKDFGIRDDELNGIWIGPAFNNQDTNRQYKHYSWKTDEDGTTYAVNGQKLLAEIDEKQGNYASTMQSADTWSTVSQAVVTARQDAQEFTSRIAAGETLTPEEIKAHAEAIEIEQRGARIARSLRTDGYTTTGPDGQPVNVGGGVGAGAPGRVKEEMERFAELFPAAGLDREPESYSPESGLERRGTSSRSGHPVDPTPPPGGGRTG